MVLNEIHTTCIPFGQIGGSIFSFAKGSQLHGVTFLHNQMESFNVKVQKGGAFNLQSYQNCSLKFMMYWN
jgi:hypothetical protein